MIQITTFQDQDRDRETVEALVVDQVADLLVMMDVVTSGGDGLETMAAEDAAHFEAYSEFREWFGPHIAAAMQSAIGQVLQAADVDASGAVAILPERLREAGRRSAATSLAGRLSWLVVEIPDLQERHGQLYDDEAREALALCERVDALDLGSDSGLAAAREAWPRLELLYQYAQRGARLARGDEVAVEEHRAALERLEERLKQKEADAAHRRAVLAGSEEPESDEDVRAAIAEGEARVQEILGALRQTDRRRDELSRRLDAVSEQLGELHVRAAEAGVVIG